MTLNELLACDVVDSRGDVVGQVHDATFVRRGDAADSYELRYLLFQPGSVSVRLGFNYSDMNGPWPIAPLVRWYARRSSHVAEWQHVSDIRDGRVYLSVTVDHLPSTVEFLEQRS